MAWTARLRGKVEILAERQCAEPVHLQDQHWAMTSAATVRAGLAGDEPGVESLAEEPIVSPVVEAARREVLEVVGPDAVRVVGRGVCPEAGSSVQTLRRWTGVHSRGTGVHSLRWTRVNGLRWRRHVLWWTRGNALW